MSYIKKLTINGNSYDIYDAQAQHINDAVIGSEGWSSKHTVEKLCPLIRERGNVVVCQPLEGYPLTVSAREGAVVTRCGKNLWNFKESVSVLEFVGENGTQNSRYGYKVKLPPGTYTIHAEPLLGEVDGWMYGYILNDSDNSIVKTAHVVVGNVLQNATITLQEDQSYILVHAYAVGAISESKANKLFKEEFNVQIETGTTVSAYAPYVGETFPAAGEIMPVPGVNSLFADAGEIAVTGRADPAAALERLTNAIIALGGNI